MYSGPTPNERHVDPWTFYTGEMIDDRLFETGEARLREILILTAEDGTETEAILPIAEYRRLKALDAPRPGAQAPDVARTSP